MPKQGPSDVNELAFDMMQRFVGAEEEITGAAGPENAARGRKGGKARAKALSPEERSKAAQKAARARWGKSKT